MADIMIYSSRSRVETFQECQRRGYIGYLWDGRGLQKRAASVYLSTGLYTHIGLEIIFRNRQYDVIAWDKCKEEYIEFAVQKAIESYQSEIKERGFDLEEGEDSQNQSFIVSEQCALVEAFIRSFAIRVLPDLLARFRIIDVEREESIQEGDLIIEGRLDVILEEISTSDIYIISFKTAASWDRRQEKANEHDNQGLSETYLLEARLREENRVLQEFRPTIHMDLNWKLDPKIIAATKKYDEYISKFLKKETVMGVLMIYMLKGKRYESYSKPGLWEQHSPLIRGYRKLVGTEYEYAGSLWYDNPSNKSGKGKLGKGWEPFNIWESEEVGFIKGWIHKAANNELGQDIIGQSFKIPAPYFRRQEHLDSWFRQTLAIEEEIKGKEKFVRNASNEFNKPTPQLLDIYFQQARKHCHYPTDCSYLDICYNNEIFNDPIGSGKFIYRMPHHIREIVEHDRLYQISKTNKESAKENKEGKGVSGENIKSKTRSTIPDETIEEIEEVVIDG